jgi:DNA-binding GntR family transcriptional regulator
MRSPQGYIVCNTRRAYASPALEGAATVSDGVIPDHRTRPPQSKTAYVVERLREEIAAGVIVAGAPLRQTEIASRYGVSPTPVREALRILEAAGTIVYSPNRGATVREMNPTDSDDLYRLRAEMEGFACELSVQRRGADLAPELERIVKQLEARDPERDHADMYRLNRDLHLHIAGAGSQVVLQQVIGVWEAFPPAVTVWGFPKIAAALHRDHRRIITAVRANDPALARRRMEEHVLNARNLRRKFVG